MTLGEFHTLVSACLKRGTALDAYIPAQAKLAVQWLERNYTMKYMETFRLLQIAVSDRVIQMPANVSIKAIKFVRIIEEDGGYNYLNKVEPEDIAALRSTSTTPAGTNVIPARYFLIGLNTLVLDSVPDVTWNGEAIFYEYTAWPTGDSSTHPLLTMATDVILAQTQLYMAVNIMKDLRMVEVYKLARDEAVNTLTRAEDETKNGGESVSMVYSPQSS